MATPLAQTAQADSGSYLGDLPAIQEKYGEQTLVVGSRVVNIDNATADKTYKLPSDKIPSGLYGNNSEQQTTVTTDRNGYPYSKGKQLSNTVTYAPNSVYISRYVSDATGQIRSINDSSLLKNAPKITPNISVSYTFVDQDAHLWMLGPSDSMKDVTSVLKTPLRPNQYDTRFNCGAASYYKCLFVTNDKGELQDFSGNSLGVKGLPSGTLYASPMNIVDGDHNIWHCSYDDNPECRKISSNKNLEAGSWDYGWSDASAQIILASDAEGNLQYLNTDAGANWITVNDFKTKPNLFIVQDQDTSTPSVFYATDTDGQIWKLQFGRSYVQAELTAYFSGKIVSSDSSPTVIACAPTTGVVPTGLSVVGLLAVGVGLLGVLLVFVRRRRV